MRLLAFLCYTAILVDGLLILFLIGSGGFLWMVAGVPLILPPLVLLAALILLARWILKRERVGNDERPEN
jgi:hypothetical protein